MAWRCCLRTFKQRCLKPQFHTRCISSISNNNNTNYHGIKYKQTMSATKPHPLFLKHIGQGQWFSSATGRNVDVSYEDLQALMQSRDIQLIDVREPKELIEFGKIPGSVNIPLSCLKEALQMPDESFSERFKHDKPQLYDTNIVFYGMADIKSRAAVELTRRIGYKKEFKALYGANKPKMQDENVVYHCMIGGRSLKAIELSEKLGYNKTRHYKGGWEEYAQKTGQPLKQTK